MKPLSIKINTLKTMFKLLEFNFGGVAIEESNEYSLKLDSSIGTGEIKGIAFGGGISYIEFNMTLSEDVTLSICSTPQKSPIYFAYCSKGNLTHSFGMTDERNVLESYQTGIIASLEDFENVFYFEKNKPLKVNLITVQTMVHGKNAENEGLKQKLYKTFLEESISKNFVYIGSQNLKIAEKIERLNAIKQKGIVRSLLVQGLVHLILALEVQQHKDDLKNKAKAMGSLNTRELEIIKNASGFIEEEFHTNLSISQLCSKFGISPSKLQEGFKQMHDRTVTDYIREVRIQKAEELIKETDMNISEVVYSIGFSSRSYFSKIFRNKYKCTPSDYKDAQRNLLISA